MTCLKNLGGPKFRRKVKTCLTAGSLREYQLSPRLSLRRLLVHRIRPLGVLARVLTVWWYNQKYCFSALES